MLKIFKEKYAGIDLECCDAHDYQDQDKYDLIFSNQLVQYFDRIMLCRHFAVIKTMMMADSLFVCGSIPWKVHQIRCRAHELDGRGLSVTRRIKAYLNRMLKRDTIGYWYDLSDFAKLAVENDMTVEFYGSFYYIYRFHAIMRLKGTTII